MQIQRAQPVRKGMRKYKKKKRRNQRAVVVPTSHRQESVLFATGLQGVWCFFNTQTLSVFFVVWGQSKTFQDAIFGFERISLTFSQVSGISQTKQLIKKINHGLIDNKDDLRCSPTSVLYFQPPVLPFCFYFENQTNNTYNTVMITCRYNVFNVAFPPAQ